MSKIKYSDFDNLMHLAYKQLIEVLKRQAEAQEIIANELMEINQTIKIYRSSEQKDL